MDFTQKIIDKQREVQELYQNEAAKKTLEKEADEEETEPEMEIPPPENPDEEWSVVPTEWGDAWESNSVPPEYLE